MYIRTFGGTRRSPNNEAEGEVKRRSQRRRTEGDQPTLHSSEAKGEWNEANLVRARVVFSRRLGSTKLDE